MKKVKHTYEFHGEVGEGGVIVDGSKVYLVCHDTKPGVRKFRVMCRVKNDDRKDLQNRTTGRLFMDNFNKKEKRRIIKTLESSAFADPFVCHEGCLGRTCVDVEE